MAKSKFLAAEALHGVSRKPFGQTNVGRNDCVTGEMWKKKPPFRLALNRAASDEIARHCKHYTERGVMKLHESGTALAEDMEAPVSKMLDSSEAHYQASLKTARNPNGEPYPVFTSDKSWDEASDKIGSEKKFYHKTPVVQPLQVPDSSDGPNRPWRVPQVCNSSTEVVGMPFVMQRKVPMIQRVQKTVEVPQIQYVDKIVEAPVAAGTIQPVSVDAESFLRVEEVSVGRRRLPPGMQTPFREGRVR